MTLGRADPVGGENFDASVAPSLPAGWATSSSNALPAWTTISSVYNSSPNCTFSPGATGIGINELVSPQITLPSGLCQLSFANHYNLEADTPPVGYDGGVLEIKIGSGAFMDILSVGGSFAQSGYNRTISSGFGNPLAGRQAWSGNSGGFVTTLVDLPPAAAGQTIQLRWRCSSDNNNASAGWHIDSVSITTRNCCDPLAPPPPPVMQAIAVANGVAVLTCFAAPGKTYRLQYKNSLDDAAWFDVLPDITSATTTLSITNDPGSAAQRFYRIYWVP
jgi:hypothetical protein